MTAKTDATARSAPIFAALGDPTRLRLVARLSAGGPQSIAGLTAGTEVTRQAVTKHLHVLAAAGLARGVRRGRESRWELEPDPLEIARRYLDRVADQWTRTLESLERHLDALGEEEGGSASAPEKTERRSAPAVDTGSAPHRIETLKPHATSRNRRRT
jgi:DNA-binding transcriptional ArsR family regulator